MKESRSVRHGGAGFLAKNVEASRYRSRGGCRSLGLAKDIAAEPSCVQITATAPCLTRNG
jgi:hypothetical protein